MIQHKKNNLRLLSISVGLLFICFNLNKATASEEVNCSASKNHIFYKYAKTTRHSENSSSSIDEAYRTLLTRQFNNRGQNKAISLNVDSHINYLMSFLNEIITKEEQNCKNSIAFYFGSGFSGAFINELRRFLIPSQFANLDQFFKTYLGKVDDPLHFDRNLPVRANLQAVSTSIASMGPNESAVDFFIASKSINLNPQTLKDYVATLASYIGSEKVDRLHHLIDTYQSKISRALIQIFVNKKIVPEIVYLSRPFGMPVQNIDISELLSQNALGFRQLQKHAQKQNIVHRLNIYTKDYAHSDFRDDSFEMGYTDYLQARVLMTSPLIYVPEQTQIYFYYPLEEAKDAQEMRTQLREIFEARF